MADKGWQRRFFDPIILSGGRELLTLRDAAEYITALPKAEHDAADAMETLLVFKTTSLAASRALSARIFGPMITPQRRSPSRVASPTEASNAINDTPEANR